MKTKTLAVIALIAFSFSGVSQKKWTLKEAVNYALKHNITIKQNVLNVKLSEEDVTINKGNFLPSVNASSSSTFTSGLSQNSSGVLAKTDNINASFNVSARGNIFNGFRNLNFYKQALLGVESSKVELQRIKDNISLNVVDAYLNILFAKENLAAAQVQYEISKNQIVKLKNEVDAGAKAKGELLNVESTAATDEQNVVARQNTLNLALLTLAQLLQVSPEGFDIATINVGSPSIATLYDDSNVVYEKAVKTRPEITKAKLGIKNAELGVEIAKGAFLPSLSYSAGAGSSFFHQFNNLRPGQRNTYFFKQVLKDRFGYNAGLSLSIPIFNGYKTRANVNKSIINKEVSEYTLESQKLQLQQTIQKVFLDAKAAAKTYESAQKSLDAQNEAFKNAQERFNFGAMTLFDFDQVRNRLVNAQSSLIRAKYDYVFKTKVLKFYYGESILD